MKNQIDLLRSFRVIAGQLLAILIVYLIHRQLGSRVAEDVWQAVRIVLGAGITGAAKAARDRAKGKGKNISIEQLL